MSEFLSAFLGGSLALFGVWLTGLIQKQQKQENDRKDELGFIASVRCEVIALERLLEERHTDILNGNLGEDGFFRFEHATNSNYLSFFDGNMNNLMKVSREDIRLQIQVLILYGRSYLDSLGSHSQLLGQVTQLEYYCHRNSDDELSKLYLANYIEAIKDFDKSLIDQAQDLQEKVKTLKISLEQY